LDTVIYVTTWDCGVILHRKLLLENMEKVERGQDPMGVIRDPAKNEPMIVLIPAHEKPKTFYAFDGVFREPAPPQNRG
jgi:5,5'-dehydrodivanillate O-demethylase